MYKALGVYRYAVSISANSSATTTSYFPIKVLHAHTTNLKTRITIAPIMHKPKTQRKARNIFSITNERRQRKISPSNK